MERRREGEIQIRREGEKEIQVDEGPRAAKSGEELVSSTGVCVCAFNHTKGCRPK